MDTDKLAALVSMGFDIDLCETVLQETHLTLEEAIERLLNAPQKVPQNEPVHEASVAMDDRKCEPVQDEDAHNKFSDIMTKDQAEKVSSRLCMSERQKEIKVAYERKEQAEVQIAAKKRKIQAKHDRALILQEIEASKKHVKDLREANKVQDNCQRKQEETHLSTYKNGSTELCRIQIRLPTGRAISQHFQTLSPLSDVVDFALEGIDNKQSIKDPVLIQPFPRREFSSDDLRSSLLSLGLHPNASLVLMLERHADQSGMAQIIQKEVATMHLYDGDRTSNVRSVHYTPQIQHHEWGGGNRLTQCSTSGEESRTKTDSRLDHRRDDICRSPFLRSVLGAAEGVLAAENDVRRRGLHESAALASASSDGSCQRQRNLEVMEAIDKRMSLAGVAEANRSKAKNISLKREIHPLVEICADCVAKHLSAQSGYVLSYIGRTLSHQAASQVIKELKERKLLTGKLLQVFHSCKLTRLDLNGYRLASNELLEAARLHTTLTCLQLAQCALITDTGLIAAVRGLKHLQLLDLSGCVQITDKSLSEIKGLRELQSLKLDNTKVKDEGMKDFLCDNVRRNLLDLSLASTNITQEAFCNPPDNVSASNLGVLLLDRTKISSLEFLRIFRKLHHISLSGTPLNADSIQSLSELKQLQELNLCHTKLPDDSLQNLVGLPLHSLGLPDRLCISDTGLRYIEGLPLTTLDLADYIQVTDVGVASVGKITSITSLSLANTKVTDDGLCHIQGLISLQELDLGRTIVGDNGVRSLRGLKSLHTLSLASTKITDEIFKDGTLNKFENLGKLNVSRNNISDSGLRNLQLMFLEIINADQTYASSLAVLELAGCPNLKAIRARNCKVKQELDEEN